MARFVLDSSALLAMLFQEPGSDKVAEVLGHAQMSAVNVTEVLTKLHDRGAAPAAIGGVRALIDRMHVAYDLKQAALAAELRGSTRALGLSLGDRACLALAKSLGLPALTGDRAWVSVASAIGVDVQLIR